MLKKIRRSLIIFLGAIFIGVSSVICYLLFFVDFPINKERFFRILKSQPHFEIDESGVDFYFNSDDLKLAGTLYGVPEDNFSKPCILILHGLTPYGRKLALYRVLGKKLADRGYLVFLINYRGFDDSQDPAINDDVFAFRKDVESAISYIFTRPGVDSTRLYLLGHSLGGSVAFVVSSYDRRIKKVIAIGPSRRVQDLVLAPLQYKLNRRGGIINAREFRLSREMGLSGNLETKIIINSIKNIFIDDYKQFYSQEDHTPLFLIDGELEDYRDKEFLSKFFLDIQTSNKYQTFKNVSHYHNTINWDGGNLIVYDMEAIFQLTESIDRWLKADQ